MKCKNCDGSGIDMFESECRFCGGKGVVEPLTNEEWFCSLTREEKAKVLSNATYSSVMNSEILILGKDGEQKKWELWLKAKHE